MKKGFTLIELLAVIVILAIVLLITVVSVDSTLLNSKKNLYSIQQKNIEEAAKTYYLKEGMLFDDECVSVSKLLSKGYLEGEKVTNAETKEEMTGYVKITYNNNQYNYKYQEDTCEIYEAIVNPAVGSTPSNDANGNIVVGSAFKIKVNNTAKPMTFFVLSNEGEYVNLIAEQNISPQGNVAEGAYEDDAWYTIVEGAISSIYGPKIAYDYLKSATDNWTNIPIIKSFSYEDIGYKTDNTNGYVSIVTSLDASTKNYKTIITPNPSTGAEQIIYENLRVRLPYEKEILDNTSCKTDGNIYSCPLWMVNYLSKNSYYLSAGKINSTDNNMGYWLLDTTGNYIKTIYHEGYIFANYHSTPNYGIRPVITIPKKFLLSEVK